MNRPVGQAGPSPLQEKLFDASPFRALALGVQGFGQVHVLQCTVLQANPGVLPDALSIMFLHVSLQ